MTLELILRTSVANIDSEKLCNGLGVAMRELEEEWRRLMVTHAKDSGESEYQKTR